jgi:uncharacterized protein with von Willebrand factor type A (vWA) domain
LTGAGEGGASGERLLQKLATFARLLRVGGIEVGPARLQDALRALAAVESVSREQSYWALRCTMISRAEHAEAFDAAFSSFWALDRAEPPPLGTPVATSAGSAPTSRERPVGAQEREFETVGDDAEAGAPQDSLGMSFSAVERLRELDFAQYTATERRQARALLARVARATPMRRTRRTRAAGSGQRLDGRRTLRGAMQTEGYPVLRSWRSSRRVPRKLLFLVDISGSMEPYARALAMFLHTAIGPGRKVEAFAFGTRLTRLTRELHGSDPDRALQAARRAVPDWAGGTRIGENLKALNDRWGPRGFTRGAVVVVVSDGWERGDTDRLGTEMQRLSLAAHTVVWVNPLAGEVGYQPLAVGMATALDHVDHFLPGHNLRSLETLAEVLEGLPSTRRRG